MKFIRLEINTCSDYHRLLMHVIIRGAATGWEGGDISPHFKI